MEVNKNKYTTTLGIIYVLLGALSFSTKAVLVKLVYRTEDVEAISSLALRMLFALPFYIGIYFWKKKDTTLSLKDWMNFAAMGFVGYYLASILDFAGLKYISAGLERLIVFLYPTMVVLISTFVMRKKLSAILYFALILTYGGIALVFLNNGIDLREGWEIGVMLVFGSALTYAIYLVGSGELVHRFDSMFYTSLSMLFATLFVLIHYVIIQPEKSLMDYSPHVYGLSALMAIFATVIPSFLILEGIRLIGSSRASVVAGIGPVSTIILGYIFLNETFSLVQGIGTVLVLTGVILVSIKK